MALFNLHSAILSLFFFLNCLQCLYSFFLTVQDPTTWQEPLPAIGKFNFTATSPQELSFPEKQSMAVAPAHLQPQLWNSGWLMASIDGKTAGLVPVNYIRLVNPAKPNAQNANQEERSASAEVNPTPEPTISQDS